MANKKGQPFWVDAAIAPVLDETGKPVQFFSLQFEITPRKNYEEQLEQQKEQLLELNQFKDKVFSIVSHDFRSPLNSLKGMLALYLQGMISHEEMKSLASELLEKLNTTSNMLDNLLHWAKNQLQGIHVKPQKIDISELVKENIELIRPLAEKKDIHLKCENHRPVSAFADEEMIKLVLRNLISNAVKFSFKGGDVGITILEEEDQVVVEVKDQGTGMNEQQKENLFNPSARSSPGTNNEKGMGLGLILCKEFVEKNGGRLWAESEEGKGSLFCFSLNKPE
jgi:signal transduction histidine kinase